jgi:hypothetical protein
MLSFGTLGSVALLLLAILYQGNPDSKISDHVDRIYPIQLEIKDTKDKGLHPSSLDIYLEISSDCKLRTIPYDNEMISIFSL